MCQLKTSAFFSLESLYSFVSHWHRSCSWRIWYCIVKAARESETRCYHCSEMVSKEISQGEWNLVFEDHQVVLAITCLGSLFLGILLAINAFSHLKVRQYKIVN